MGFGARYKMSRAALAWRYSPSKPGKELFVKFDRVFLVSMLFAILLMRVRANALDELHPRLFVDEWTIASIRENIEIPGSHHQEAYDALKARVDRWDPTVYDTVFGYHEATLAKEAAFMFLITEESSYAELAYDMLQQVALNPAISPFDARKALARAMTGLSFALAYDWCYEGWTPAQREWARSILVRSLNEWTEFEYPEEGWGKGTNHIWEPYTSNWVAVCQGSQVLMTLAAYEETSQETNVYRDSAGAIVPNLSRAARFAAIKSQLKQHLQSAYGPLGVTGEGISYMGYAASFLLPCLHALYRTGDIYLHEEAAKHEWWKWILYASSFEKDRLSIQNGVAATGGIGGIGTASLLLGSVPQATLPYYRFFYDRFMGKLSPRSPSMKYDEDRAGTVWALLFYPDDVISQDPTGIMPRMAADTLKGAFFFRNRWRDENDILVSFMTDGDWQTGVHNIPEAFQFNVIAHGNKYAGSPGGYDKELMSALFVDGHPCVPNSKKSSNDTGTVEFYEVGENGGYVIAGGGRKYARLGLSSAYRHFRVHFAENKNRAVIATLDQLESTENRLYSWRMNVGDKNGTRGISISAGTEGNRPTFLLQNGDGGYLKGWVLHPADAEIEPADPLRISTTGAGARIMVVMVVDSGVPQVGAFDGEGLNTQLTLGERIVRYDTEANRIAFDTCSNAVPNPRQSATMRGSGLLSVGYRPLARKAVLRIIADGSATRSLAVHNAAGKLIRELPVVRRPGQHNIVWDCRNNRGEPVAPGAYIVTYKAGRIRDVERVIIH
ncbi:MAG: hypothetical protein GF344_13705 [Chitinivibrionales bacterium]|nr:hypothetical protein [Chitinivibrionales bacterium]MBD3357784.1 hypothetical protein [Chitinivibrionales bacterium]